MKAIFTAAANDPRPDRLLRIVRADAGLRRSETAAATGRYSIRIWIPGPHRFRDGKHQHRQCAPLQPSTVFSHGKDFVYDEMVLTGSR